MAIAMAIPADATMDLNGRDRNVRDVLTHLHEWHLMMQDWYKVGMAGKKPAIPREGYTFQTLPAMNRVIWEKYQKTAPTKAFDLIRQSHTDVMNLARKHTDDELFTKKKYPWTHSHKCSQIHKLCQKNQPIFHKSKRE
jgi:hypothetical protein